MKTKSAILLIALFLCVGLKSTAQVLNYYSYLPKNFIDNQGNSSSINDFKFIQENPILVIKKNNDILYLSIGQMDNLSMTHSLTMGPVGGLLDEPLNGYHRDYSLKFEKKVGDWNEYYSKFYNSYYLISKDMKKLQRSLWGDYYDVIYEIVVAPGQNQRRPPRIIGN